MTWGAVRAFFYVWFSAAAGLAAAYAIGFAITRTPGPSLPGGGWPLIITPPALILASLVSTQLSHFGQRISLLRWIPLCVGATVALLAVVQFGSGL